MRWATTIGGRYMGAYRAEEFGRRHAMPEELPARVTPTKIVAKTGIADSRFGRRSKLPDSASARDSEGAAPPGLGGGRSTTTLPPARPE
jgi:hypothetical protein